MKKYASMALAMGLLAIFAFPDRSESQQIRVAYAASTLSIGQSVEGFF